MKAKAVKMAVTVIVAMIISSASAYFLAYKPYLEKQALEQTRLEQAVRVKKAKELAAKRAAERARAEAEAQAQAEEWQRRLKLATLGKGEGVEHPFIRQLVYNPGKMDGVKIKVGKKYDLSFAGGDEKAVKKWAGQTAHLLAIFFGYVDQKTGRQIRVKKAGEVAFLIDVESDKKSLDVVIYKKEAKSRFSNYEQFASAGWLGVDEQTTFLADVKDGLGSFEYVWPPTRKAKKQKK